VSDRILVCLACGVESGPLGMEIAVSPMRGFEVIYFGAEVRDSGKWQGP
jgi:hypothetical protein